MKEWFSGAELAGLPGMFETRQGVWEQAKAGDWAVRKRQGRGGGNEYHISSLPAETRAYLLSNQPKSEAVQMAELSCANDILQTEMQKAIEENVRADGIKDYLSLTGDKKADVDKKLAIIAAYKRFHDVFSPRGDGCVMDRFLNAFRAGSIAIDEAIRAEFYDLDRSTLYRWVHTMETKGAGALADKRGWHRKGQSIIETTPELLEYCVTKLFNTPQISCVNIYHAIKADFSGKGIKLPSRKSVERFLRSYKSAHPDLIQAVTNPDGFKNRTMTAFGDLVSDVERLNQRWVADSSPADIMLKKGRYHLIAILDLYSRRAKLLVTKTSKATAISLLLRRCIMDWGVPEELKADNGKDYRSKHLENCALMLNVKQLFSAPFSPWEKGNVERFFRTYSHGMLPMLKGFIGHNVADQQEIRAQQAFSDRLFKKNEVIDAGKMDVKSFQKFCDDWCTTIYEQRQHSGLNNKTPAEVASEYRGTIVRIADERQLDLLLAETPDNGGWRRVVKKGLRLDNEIYIASALERYVGFDVQVKYDPSDMGVVYVYAYQRPDDPFATQPNEDGLHFVCKAYCAALMGEERQKIAIESRQSQTKRMQEGKKAVKQAGRKFDHEGSVQRIIEHNRKEQDEKNVVYLPNRNVIEHDAPGTRAVKSALEKPKSQFEIEMETITHEDGIAMLEDVRSKPPAAVQRPMFASYIEKSLWIVDAWMAEIELSGEELIFMSRLDLDHPNTYAFTLDVCNSKYGELELYQAFKKAVNWK